jgi:hypothetical protein
MNPKEQWIDETLDALDGMESVSLPEEIKARILQNPSHHSMNTPTKPLSVWSIAAAIILLIALNFATGWIIKSGTDNETADYTASSSLEYLTPINY